MPGQELLAGSESRASGVVERILTLDDAEVERALASVMHRFASRHRALSDIFSRHADRISNRIADEVELSDSRRLLLGATFTHEFAIEAAAVCNPSIVVHPDQRTTPPGDLRFIMSVRGIGEGHRSSIGFRTGSIHADGTVTIDAAGPFPATGSVAAGPFDRDVFHGKLSELGADGENAAYVLDALDDEFTEDELDLALARLRTQRDTRRTAGDTSEHLRAIAACSYTTGFPAESDISERVLWPAAAAESQGMEDARFVRFVDDDGSSAYYATYTAFDGIAITQQLLETTDFVTFTASPIVGAAAGNKGLALFPRRVGGRFAPCRDVTAKRTPSRSPRTCAAGAAPSPCSTLSNPGRRSSSATAGPPSRPAKAGSCSPTGSGRCAPTASARYCSTWTTRRSSSAGCTNPSWSPRMMSRTVTSPTSSTAAERSSTRTRS